MVNIARAQTEQAIPVPTDEENYLLLEVLKRFFPDAVGLMYYQDGELEPVSLDKSLTKLVPPNGGWNKRIYYIVKRSIPVETTEANTDKSIAKYFEYLLYLLVGNTRLCVTIVEEDLAVTASHCIPKDKKLNDLITVFNQNGNEYNVKIVFQDRNLDIAFLQTIDKKFDVEPLEIGYNEIGKDYFALGYPLDEDTGHQFIKSPSVVKGSIMTYVVRNGSVYGNSVGSKGFSGGPVISLDHPRHLIGIALGGRGFPKTWPLQGFFVQMLTFCGETPRLKIYPAASAISSLRAVNNERKGVKRPATDEDEETVD